MALKAGYNPLAPDLGRAGQPYARSVPTTRPLNNQALPDAGRVFDELLRLRKNPGVPYEDFEEPPGGLSSLFFAFADLVIHTVFHTARGMSTTNLAASYVDLSPLYGSLQEVNDGVRDKKKGLGLLYEDVFADVRMLGMPPAVPALLVLFSRNHNVRAHGRLVSCLGR
jgi:hypothetical protein